MTSLMKRKRCRRVSHIAHAKSHSACMRLGMSVAYAKEVVMISRQDVLTLTGFSASAFNSLAHREMLPFSAGPSAQHGRYTEEQVVRLCLFKALTAAGLPQAQATDTLRMGFWPIQTFLAREPQPARADVLLGAINSEAESAGASKWRPAVGLWTPTKCLVHAVVADGVERVAHGPTAVVFTNASQAMTHLYARAYRRSRSGGDLAEWAKLFRAVLP